MRFLDERRSRARVGASSPRRLRFALALVLLALAAAFFAQCDAQETLALTARLAPRAREAARQGVLQELDDYFAVRKATRSRLDPGPEALTLEQQTRILFDRWEQGLSDDGILRHARTLAKEDQEQLAAARDRLAGAAALLLLALLAAQVEAARRTRRLVNPQLLLATVLAAWATLEPLRRVSTALDALSPERALSGAFSPDPLPLAGSALLAAGGLAALGLWQRWQEFERG